MVLDGALCAEVQLRAKWDLSPQRLRAKNDKGREILRHHFRAQSRSELRTLWQITARWQAGIFKELAERTLWTSPLGVGDRGTRWWPSGISGSDGTADEGIQLFYNSAERGYFKTVASEPNTEARCSSNC